MSAHTPGPWKVVNHPRVAHVDSMRSVGHGANGMASIVWLTGGALAQEANAALIAAAPDLLDVLEMIRDADEDCRRDGLPQMNPMARRRLDAVLAKATGGK